MGTAPSTIASVATLERRRDILDKKFRLMDDPKRSLKLKKVTWSPKLTEVLVISPREEKKQSKFLWAIEEESSPDDTAVLEDCASCDRVKLSLANNIFQFC